MKIRIQTRMKRTTAHGNDFKAPYKQNSETDAVRDNHTLTERPVEDSQAPRPRRGRRNQASRDIGKRE